MRRNMLIMLGWVVVGLLVMPAIHTVSAEEATPQELNGLPLVFQEDFEKDADRWEPTDPNAWKVTEQDGNHVFSLHKPSEYEPPFRSPFNIAWIKDLNVSDAIIEAKMEQTGREYGHRDMCVFFGRQDTAHFYYIHIATAADEVANTILIVNGAPRVSIVQERTEGTDWTTGYHTVRVVRDTKEGSIRVYFDDMENPIMKTVDKTFLSGGIGFGSFDDTGNIDDIKVWGKRVSTRRQAPSEHPRILFLSKSSGFEHDVIKDEDGKLNHATRVLQQIAPQLNGEVVASKDASLINAENLKNYDLVIFYTTGDLTDPGKDGNPSMGENGVADLLAWIRDGGGFMGFHAATDTFPAPESGPFTPYTEMIGAEFVRHGDKFEGIVRVVDPTHPATASMPPEWNVFDEWYLFKFADAESLHVLALLDPGDERSKQPEYYDIPSYPIIWCKEFGKGRVYYNGMGHEFDVWSDPAFQQVVLDAARWAMGEGAAQTEPNYAHVVPKTKTEGSGKEGS